MLEKAGLSLILHALKTNPVPKSRYEDSSPVNVARAVLKLDQFLLELSMEMSDKLYRLQNSQITKRVALQGSLTFLHEYKYIHEVIVDPANEFSPSILKRTPYEVETLLSLHEND